jgi:MFS-type transporter involved in bile tolerance (Atg22 family)
MSVINANGNITALTDKRMDIAMLIGIGMLIIFLLAVIVRIWKDNRNERKYWENRK